MRLNVTVSDGVPMACNPVRALANIHNNKKRRSEGMVEIGWGELKLAAETKIIAGQCYCFGKQKLLQG